ncbi:MAG: acetate/propionate family kinase [Rhodospirillales bacterium]|nr:acetate/propionate family kinase [Rhodospirillales bacterium]
MTRTDTTSTSPRHLCVMNAGSSSLKFGVYLPDEGLKLRMSGAVEGIGGAARLRIVAAGGQETHTGQHTVPDHAAALRVLEGLEDGPLARGSLMAFGHRVVHGGAEHDAPVRVDEEALRRIEALSSLAPLHNPPAVAVIRELMRLFPDIPQVACFDTAFHRSHPAVADRFAIPDALYQEGVRRYGFHGLSYEFIAGALGEDAPEIALGRVVVAHLGSGASMCALAGGRSVDSSMGFTALDGLPMGTRSGSLDAGVILWLQQQKHWSVDQVEEFLYQDCGLKGLSGVSNDMRELLASTAPLAHLAVEYFVYHVARMAGALAASMGGIDGFVFTAGIGERSPEIRARVLRRLSWLGFSIDEAANRNGGPKLTRPDSRLPAYVIPTDEELVIARHTQALVQPRPATALV